MSFLKAFLLRDWATWRAFPKIADIEEPVEDRDELARKYFVWRDDQLQRTHDPVLGPGASEVASQQG